MPQRALSELLCGKGAHADPVACVEDISAELAGRSVAGFPHSISEIVFHMNYWMSYELRRIRGERPAYPVHNAESFPEAGAPGDEQAWDRRRTEFAELLAEYGKMADWSRDDLDRKVEIVHESQEKLAGNVEAVLWQMAAHNSYHVGQIALIRRLLGAWPPKAGGSTW